jgi:DNA helicase-2/ATP-dependent DNA helicase PcrA
MISNAEQLSAIHANFHHPLCILAGPGSGKTHTVVERVKYLYESAASNINALVLTFSKSAVAEMKSRIQNLSYQSNIHVYTFHAFGLKIISDHWSRLHFAKRPTLCSRKQAIGIIKVLLT